MRRYWTITAKATNLFVAVLLLVSGCAGLADRALLAESVLCLPPGIADVPPPPAMVNGTWVRTREGPGVLLHYHVGAQHIDVLWVDGEPMAIDPDATDMAVPVWIRTQREPCTWISEIVGAKRI